VVSAEDKREDPADAELSRPAENSNGEDGRQKGALRHIATKATRRLLGVLFPHFRLVGLPKIIWNLLFDPRLPDARQSGFFFAFPFR
jgi:hypothetical protein